MVLVNLFWQFGERSIKVCVLPVHAARPTKRRPLRSGVEPGLDGAAGVDEMEGEVSSAEDEPVFIQMPANAPPADKLAFGKCDIFTKKVSGSLYVKCTLCGRTVTTSSHKMIYGHYLQTDAGIQKCLDKERLRELDQDFIQSLESRQAKLHVKRK